MAIKRKVSAAPVRQKLRKNHGPKRFLFHGWNKVYRHEFARAGVINKYSDIESFGLACSARGVKYGVKEMWEEFSILPRVQQDAYLADIQNRATAAMKRVEERRRKAKKLAKAQ